MKNKDLRYDLNALKEIFHNDWICFNAIYRPNKNEIWATFTNLSYFIENSEKKLDVPHINLPRKKFLELLPTETKANKKVEFWGKIDTYNTNGTLRFCIKLKNNSMKLN